MIADMPEVYDTTNLLIYLRWKEMCRILFEKAKTSAINRGRESSRDLIQKF
jgi:hypothetical protein